MDNITEHRTMNQTSQESAPRYTHDCARCVFLAQRGEDDLYFCPSPVEATVIARASSDGPDYRSGLAFAFGANAALTAARAIAQARGLAEYDLFLALHSMREDAPLALLEELRTHLQTSEVARASRLLATDVPAGRAALKQFLDARVQHFTSRLGSEKVEGLRLRAWAQQEALGAHRWLERLEEPGASAEDFARAAFLM
jgi:hypothetical protein